jgi:Ni/Co efflux regulator RcnB
MKISTMTGVALAAAMTMGMAQAQFKQDAKDTGHDAKATTKDAGHDVAHGTEVGAHKTAHATKHAYHKTKHVAHKVEGKPDQH